MNCEWIPWNRLKFNKIKPKNSSGHSNNNHLYCIHTIVDNWSASWQSDTKAEIERIQTKNEIEKKKWNTSASIVTYFLSFEFCENRKFYVCHRSAAYRIVADRHWFYISYHLMHTHTASHSCSFPPDSPQMWCGFDCTMYFTRIFPSFRFPQKLNYFILNWKIRPQSMSRTLRNVNKNGFYPYFHRHFYSLRSTLGQV